MANNIKEKTGNLIQQLKDCFFSSESASIAFTSMFAVIPLFAVILFGSSYIASKFGFNQCESNLENLIQWLFEVFKLKDVNDKFIESAKNYINNFGIGDPRFFIGIIAFIWSITGVYYEIENFFNKIWEIKDNRTWGEKRFLNKKAFYCVVFFIILSIVIAIVNIFIPLDKIAILVEFFVCCWVILFLAYKFIPKQQPKGKNAILSSFVISIFTIITLVISSFIISLFSYKEIYGSQLFFYLLIYQFIWTGILAGCRLTFELEMGFSDYMGEKRPNWKDMSYQRKEALCWYVYNKIENNDNAIKDNSKDTYKIDPKILLWALRKLSDLDLIDLNDEKSSIKGTKKEIKDFHDYFYTSGKHLVNDVELNDDYKEALLNVENILKEGLKEINGNKQEKIEPVKQSLLTEIKNKGISKGIKSWWKNQ